MEDIEWRIRRFRPPPIRNQSIEPDLAYRSGRSLHASTVDIPPENAARLDTAAAASRAGIASNQGIDIARVESLEGHMSR